MNQHYIANYFNHESTMHATYKKKDCIPNRHSNSVKDDPTRKARNELAGYTWNRTDFSEKAG